MYYVFETYACFSTINDLDEQLNEAYTNNVCVCNALTFSAISFRHTVQGHNYDVVYFCFYFVPNF